MKLYQHYLGQFQSAFYAGCTLGVLASSCIGGIAAMAVLENGTSPFQIFQLAIVTAMSMGFNVSVLSQQKPVLIFNFLWVGMAINSVLAVINFAVHGL